MIKDLLQIGLGGMLLAKDKLEQEVQTLVQKGKISKEDATKFLEESKQKAQKQEEKLKDLIKSCLKEAIQELDIATKADIEELKKKK